MEVAQQYQIETKLDAKKQRALTKFGHSFALFVAGALGNVVEEYGVRCAACHVANRDLMDPATGDGVT